jgi:drug/metabolite transporter (DMT)-like permease
MAARRSPRAVRKRCPRRRRARGPGRLGLIAGPFNLVLAVSIGGLLPGASAAALAGLVGFAGYGISLVLFVLALRDLGTARTGAYFATAPLVGAVAAIAFLHEPLTLQLAAAGLLMGTGVAARHRNPRS